MRILDDTAEAGAHEFAVELGPGGEPDGARVRERGKASPDNADHGVTLAMVRCEGGKADPAAVRTALECFNEVPDDGWRWTVDALAAYLLNELCGIALPDCRRRAVSADANAAQPPVGPGDLPEVIDAAWQEVVRGRLSDDARSRSKSWVDALAKEFAARYEGVGDCRVFWRSNCGNRREFGLNELLFDIVACEVQRTKPLGRRPAEIEFVAHCHWLVESEFSKNTRDIAVDMSKLVIGAAPYKLFVAAHRPPDVEQELLKRCKPIARRCGAETFLAFVSHPEDWGTERQRPPAVHTWADNEDIWRNLSDSPHATSSR